LYTWLNANKKPVIYAMAAFFLFSAIGEFAGLLLDICYPDEMNVKYYDKYFIPALYLAQFGIFFSLLKNKRHKQITLLMGLIYMFSFLLEKFVMEYDIKELSYFTYCMGAIFVILMCLLYLFTLIKSPAILYFKSDINFWFSVGSLFFQLFTFPFFALMDVWFTLKHTGNAYYLFTIYCIYISYLFYATGILCLNLKTK
jgi:hypothetical protein